ncbi:MAG: hypothetical protein JSV79_14665, partial [Armatimonadota bacterium]
VNENRGAESVVSLLLARLVMAEVMQRAADKTLTEQMHSQAVPAREVSQQCVGRRAVDGQLVVRLQRSRDIGHTSSSSLTPSEESRRRGLPGS